MTNLESNLTTLEQLVRNARQEYISGKDAERTLVDLASAIDTVFERMADGEGANGWYCKGALRVSIELGFGERK